MLLIYSLFSGPAAISCAIWFTDEKPLNCAGRGGMIIKCGESYAAIWACSMLRGHRHIELGLAWTNHAIQASEECWQTLK
eukprot:scaffold1315_cov124-Isochrysis_galbana.AAC.1